MAVSKELGKLRYAAVDLDALDRLHAAVDGAMTPYALFDGAVRCAYCAAPQGEPQPSGCPSRFLGAMLDRWPILARHLRRSLILLTALDDARLGLADHDRVTAPPRHDQEQEN